MLAREQAIKENVSSEMMAWIRESAPRIVWVTVVVRSLDKREARELRVLVKAAEKVIVPTSTEAKDLGFVPKTQRYTYNVNAEFLYAGGLKPEGSVSVVVGWPDKSRIVEFDLDAIR